MIEPLALAACAKEQIDLARAASSGRSATVIHGGRDCALRQTVLGLAAGSGLGEHESPGEATLQVLAGRVRLTVGEHYWEGSAGDYVIIPSQRHGLDAIEDAGILITVLTTPSGGS